MRHFRLGIWAVAAGLFGSGCASLSPLTTLEHRLAFVPLRYPLGDWQPTDLQPEDAWFTAADGTRLHGWYVEHPWPRAVVLFCHGNAGNITYLASMLNGLRRRYAVSVLAFDYRGYGRSEGRPSEEGILQDARAARRWLARRARIAEQDIVLMGQSLGGAVAIDLARDGARGLILASTFTSFPDVAQSHVIVPVKALTTLEFNSLEKIRQYRGPVLISHGDADEVVPFDHGLALYDAAPGPKRFVRIPRGRHNDKLPGEYWETLDVFLSTLPQYGMARVTGNETER
jgi:fermentation-respiration switch protein FrsA (DUF1100 family)